MSKRTAGIFLYVVVGGFGLYIFHVGPSKHTHKNKNKSNFSQVNEMCENMRICTWGRVPDLSCGGEGYGKEAHGLRLCGLVCAWLRAEGSFHFGFREGEPWGGQWSWVIFYSFNEGGQWGGQWSFLKVINS